jgi:hypothetical protein
MTIERSFKGVSDTWPLMADPAMPSLWSPRPDPSKLLQGMYDAAFTSALKTAPPGSMLTCWHEAEQSGLTASTARKVHTYMHFLVHSTGSLVPYGIVTSQGASSSWDVPGMDYYGGDIYDTNRNGDFRTHVSHWASNRPHGPRVIAETNSALWRHRPAWFAGLYLWLAARKGLAMMTFWNPDGPLSGPWRDQDVATIVQLNDIARAAPHAAPLLP